MVLLSEIEQVYRHQQVIAKEEKTDIERTSLEKISLKGHHIDVITGIRRSGKSTLMMQLMHKCKNTGYLNFEDARLHGFEVTDFQKLDEVMGSGIQNYFFDEIQNVQSWELFIRQLHDRGKKIFITGSNASLLSKELGTRLTGRHLRHELFPFSYPEFLKFRNLENNNLSFEEYIQNGGFPEYLDCGNEEILQTLVKDIVLRDVAIRYGIRNTGQLMDLSLYLISNIGKECTYNSLRKSFSLGSANTVSDYLSWMEDSYLLFFLRKFSWSSKTSAVNPRKVYAVDTGLINANSLSFTKDKGRLLENAVYIHLRKQYPSLFYFREKGECDFVVFEKNKCKMLIQVCEELHTDNKRRETEGLCEAMRFFKMKEGFIITKNQKDSLMIENMKINLLPAHQFMKDNI